MFNAKFVAPWLVVLGLFVFASSASAMAPLAPLPDEPCGETYTIGPLTAAGYGPTEKDAQTAALADMADQVDIIQNGLPPQDVVIGVYSNMGTWDPPIYEIEFTVVVIITCNE